MSDISSVDDLHRDNRSVCFTFLNLFCRGRALVNKSSGFGTSLNTGLNGWLKVDSSCLYYKFQTYFGW